MAEAVLEVDGLRKVYATRRDSFVALESFSLRMAPREAVAVVGESGSGKTTTARLIAGLEQPTAGRLVVCGEDWSASKSRRVADRRRRGRRTQMVFQDPYTSLDPRQTVGAGLDEILDVHFTLDEAERERRIAELLEAVGLDPSKGRSRPGALSGGERQRVAIARALAPEPQLMLLDEAVSALDVSIQAQILNLLRRIRQERDVAYLFISHDLAVVRQVAERVVVMRDGRIVEEGPVEAILSGPADAYTRRLIESVPRPGWNPGTVAGGVEG
jgi:peptide/nickel transport system ATP-binding protein